MYHVYKSDDGSGGQNFVSRVSTSSHPRHPLSATNDLKGSACIRAILEAYDASDVMVHDHSSRRHRQRPVVELDSNVSPLEAATVLWEDNILAAPVWDERQMRYIGFFDMRDILKALTVGAEKLQHKGGKDREDRAQQKGGKDGQDHSMEKAASASGSGEYRSMIVSCIEEMNGDQPTIEKLASQNHFYSCTPHTTLADLCRVLSMMGCHRMPVVGVHRRLSYIITQSALLRFLDAKLGSGNGLDTNGTSPGGGSGIHETLDAAGLEYRKEVICVRDTAKASEAFEMLVSHRLSGVAVCDGEGRLIASTSAKDIKRAALDEGRTAMDATIIDYLLAVRQANSNLSDFSDTDNDGEEENGDYDTSGVDISACYISEDGTVRRVIYLMAKTGEHRVFVVDKDRRPVGVISVTNLINFALGRPQSTDERRHL